MNLREILVIDNDRSMLSIISDALTLHNYHVHVTENPLNVKTILETVRVSVIIMDINMPQMNGLELLEDIQVDYADIPVIMITGDADSENIMQSFKLGAYDFLKKPFTMDELIISVSKALEKYQMQKELNDYHEHLEEKILLQTSQLRKAKLKIEKNLMQTIMALVNVIEANDEYTKGHSERVTILSLKIGHQLKLSYNDLQHLQLGAILHDIGKIGIDDSILRKPERLSESEFDQMKKHPEIGINVISPIDLHDEVLNIIQQHHEKINGSGYPNKLDNNEISFLTKIVSVADAFDAMTSDRPYRKGMDKDKALKEIVRFSGIYFDKDVVEAFENTDLDTESSFLHKLV